MTHPDTLESLMLAISLFLMFGGIFFIGAVLSRAISFWSQHSRAVRAGQQATYNRRTNPSGNDINP